MDQISFKIICSSELVCRNMMLFCQPGFRPHFSHTAADPVAAAHITCGQGPLAAHGSCTCRQSKKRDSNSGRIAARFCSHCCSWCSSKCGMWWLKHSCTDSTACNGALQYRSSLPDGRGCAGQLWHQQMTALQRQQQGGGRWQRRHCRTSSRTLHMDRQFECCTERQGKPHRIQCNLFYQFT